MTTTIPAPDITEAVPTVKQPIPPPPPPPPPMDDEDLEGTRCSPGRAQFRRAAPHVVVTALLVAAGAAEVAETATGDAATVAMATIAVAVVVAVVSVCIQRVRVSMRAAGTGWSATWVLGAIGWLAMTAITGVTWETTAALLVGGWSLGLRHWRDRRIPNRPPIVPETVAEKRTAAVVPVVVQRWNERIGSGSGVLSGAELVDREDAPGGEKYTVQLVAGRQTVSDLINALPKIASGLRCSFADLVVETIPGDDSMVKLAIMPASPLKTATAFAGPYVTAPGLIGLGPWGDGSGLATWRLYSPNSMWGGVIIGGTGSGKSELINLIMVSAMSRGDTAIVYIDGQDGNSSPEMLRGAHWPVTRDNALAALVALHQIVTWRSRENAVNGHRGFSPSPERPGILVVVDECHEIFEKDPFCKALAEDISRIGRKVGVAILAASQYAGAKTFGNSTVLRDRLMEGNAVCLRTASKAEKNFFPGLELNPVLLPANLPGYGYLVDVTGGGSLAPFRGAFLENVLTWIDRYEQVAFDTVAATVAGEVYLKRHEQVATDVSGWAQTIALLQQGIVPTNLSVPVNTAGPNTHASTATTNSSGGFNFKPSVRLTDAMAASTTLADVRPSLDDLSGAARAVYDAIADGATKPSQIQQATTFSETYVRKQLATLVDKDLIANPDFGRYTLRPALRAA